MHPTLAAARNNSEQRGFPQTDERFLQKARGPTEKVTPKRLTWFVKALQNKRVYNLTLNQSNSSTLIHFSVSFDTNINCYLIKPNNM